MLYPPLEKGWALHLTNTELLSAKTDLCQVWLKLAQCVWRRFLNIVNVFLLFRYYFPLEKGVALHLNKLESPSPKDPFCKVGWNWPCISEKDFWLLLLYFRLVKGVALHLTTHESHSLKAVVCQVWLSFLKITKSDLFCKNSTS